MRLVIKNYSIDFILKFKSYMGKVRWLDAEKSKCLKLKTFVTVPNVNLSINLRSKVHLASKSKELAWSRSTMNIDRIPINFPREAIL